MGVGVGVGVWAFGVYQWMSEGVYGSYAWCSAPELSVLAADRDADGEWNGHLHCLDTVESSIPSQRSARLNWRGSLPVTSAMWVSVSPREGVLPTEGASRQAGRIRAWWMSVGFFCTVSGEMRSSEEQEKSYTDRHLGACGMAFVQ